MLNYMHLAFIVSENKDLCMGRHLYSELETKNYLYCTFACVSTIVLLSYIQNMHSERITSLGC